MKIRQHRLFKKQTEHSISQSPLKYLQQRFHTMCRKLAMVSDGI